MISQGLAEVQLIGNLVAAPELTMAGETPKVKIRIAVNESWTSNGVKEEYVSFFTIIVWGNRAKACNEYLTQGQQIVVLGRLRQERFDAADGTKVSYVNVVAREVIFGDKAKGSAEATTHAETAEGPGPIETEALPF